MSGNVLIYRDGQIGDTLIVLPCLHKIRQLYPNSKIYITTPPISKKWQSAVGIAPVLDGSGLVDGYFERQKKHPWKVFMYGLTLKKHNIKTLIWMPIDPLKRLNRHWLPKKIFFKLCGVDSFFAEPNKYPENEPCLLSTGLYKSRAQRTAETLKDLAVIDVNNIDNFDLLLTETEKQKAESILSSINSKKIIVVCFGTKRFINDWEDKNWKPLLAKIAMQYPELYLVAIGSKSDKERSNNLCASWENRFLNLCGEISVRESSAVLAKSLLYIGHDSGPMHLAAASKTKCVAIFSSRNLPGEWFPAGKGHHIIYKEIECQGCHLGECTERNKECILSISVDEVFLEIERALIATI